MDFFEAVQNRYSYRGKFKSIPIKEQDKIKILQSAVKAPSGCNLETSYFIAVTNKNLLNELSSIIPMPAIQTAPLIVAVLTENIITKCNVAFELEDYGAAVENLLLAVTALGYASVWIDGALKSENKQEKIKSLLGVKDNKILRAILPIGIPAEDLPRKQKKEFNERVRFID